MGLFDNFKKSKENTPSAESTTPTNKLDALSSSQSVQQIKLTKSKADLSTAIKLTKEKFGADLSDIQARVAVVMDISGSMEWQYSNGNVQNILTRLLPLALQFDDNGELEVFLFSNNCKKVSTSMTEENFENYVNKEIIGKYSFGGTQYAPAVKMTDEFYDDKESKNLPTLVLFITDGENSDESATNQAIIKSAKHGIFYEFIGIGNSRFGYLEELDNLEGRSCDNTGFITVEDFEKADNVNVFLDSLKDFVPWLKLKGYLK